MNIDLKENKHYFKLNENICVINAIHRDGFVYQKIECLNNINLYCITSIEYLTGRLYDNKTYI